MITPKIEITQSGAITTIISNGGIRILQVSDVHFDSVFCHRQQFYEDLQYAVDTGTYVIVVGDIYDAMNGRFDPRRSMSDVRPEYRTEKYYDAIVDDSVEKLEPYAKNILMVCYGNHETAVLKNANTDIIERLANGLSTEEHKVYVGGYGGIIRFLDGNGNVPVKYFHGSGGEAPVTRGAIQTNRQAAFLPDFQIVMNGHSHHMYIIPITRERVSLDGQHYFDIQYHLRSPGYVLSYGDGTTGWEVTRGGVPKPIGGILIEINENEIMATPRIHPPKPIKPVFGLYEGIEFPQE